MTFSIEPIAGLWDELAPLFERAFVEVAELHGGGLDINRGAYEQAEAAGCVQAFTVRDGDALTGYAIFFVGPHPHFGTCQATCDAIYLDKKSRQGLVALAFLRYIEQELSHLGVTTLYLHAKVSHPALGKLLARRGFTTVDVLWGKALPCLAKPP